MNGVIRSEGSCSVPPPETTDATSPPKTMCRYVAGSLRISATPQRTQWDPDTLNVQHYILSFHRIRLPKMKRDVLEDRDAVLEEKKKTLEDKVFNFLMSDRLTFTYIFIGLTLTIVYLIRVFSDAGFDRTTRFIEATVLWLWTFKYYLTARLYPDSRSTRWWFRILFIMSIMSTIHWILGMPGPPLPWKDW